MRPQIGVSTPHPHNQGRFKVIVGESFDRLRAYTECTEVTPGVSFPFVMRPPDDGPAELGSGLETTLPHNV